MARRPKSALDALKRVSAETAELFDRLANVAERATDRTSEVLVGVAGGALFLLLTYGVSVAVSAVSFALSGPIAACIGLPIGILLWRGGRRFRIEREATESRLQIEGEIARNRLKADEVLKRLKLLPKDAPQQLKDALYLEYLALAASLRLPPHSAVRGEDLAPPLALPAPTQRPLALPPPESFDIPEPIREANKSEKIERKTVRKNKKLGG
jgi:hypothetical protein